jgi:hypothetical protein
MDIVLTRGKTLPDSGGKSDLHDLIDLTTAAGSNIVDADISAGANIQDSKLDTITTANKVALSALQATGNYSPTGNWDFSGGKILGQNAFIFEGATTNDFQTTFSITDPTADRTITFPDSDVTIGEKASLGSWASKNANTTYNPSTDVFVTILAVGSSSPDVVFLTDGSSPPTTERLSTANGWGGTDERSFTGVCKAGDYWRVTSSGLSSIAIYEIPLS